MLTGCATTGAHLSDEHRTAVGADVDRPCRSTGVLERRIADELRSRV